MLELSIIILNYNTSDLLDKCLASIYKNAPSYNYEIIVVDNCSDDNSLKMLKKKYKEVVLLQNKVNLGYSKGNNLGIKKSKGKYVLLLNSDTEIIGDALDVMVKCLIDNTNVGILGCKLINSDLTSQKSAGVFYTPMNLLFMLFGGQKLGFLKTSPDSYRFVDWVSGACFLVKREVFNKIGLLDEFLFMYMEEVEFCYRAKKQGFLTAFTNKAVVFHKELGSAKKGKQDAILNIYRGLIYFYHKYLRQGENYLKFVLKTKAVLCILIGLISGNRELMQTYVKAYRMVV
jgi:GT2 family glycosyltransferase